MKSYTNIVGLVLLLLLFSCANKDNKTSKSENSQISVTLEKLDSIQIDYLGITTVHDIDPVSETVLFSENLPYSEEIFIADFNGSIQSSFSKLGDVPDGYGGLLSSLRLNSDSSFIAYGYKGFLSYDFSRNLLSQTRIDDFQIPSFSIKAMGYGMEKFRSDYLYVNQSSSNFFNPEYALTYLLRPETASKSAVSL
ncbi:hypothetical protein DN752_14535 [Echinicola strongylocentroti]|uniref:6-bladed beta-propeller n=1 Tax=Echinicola strongylocentroti TaxID=1795355 RepID=A0A2Z4IJB9_9BACT|nr:hypothetical protein [Echinicola strongylocentroti]AWW31242.1 hypothetical protein DN752_14535 [Echinicola strongylocentroti]